MSDGLFVGPVSSGYPATPPMTTGDRHQGPSDSARLSRYGWMEFSANWITMIKRTSNSRDHSLQRTVKITQSSAYAYSSESKSRVNWSEGQNHRSKTHVINICCGIIPKTGSKCLNLFQYNEVLLCLKKVLNIFINFCFCKYTLFIYNDNYSCLC